MLDTNVSMVTFHKLQKEIIDGFNDTFWLVFNVSTFVHGYSKRYIDSRCSVNLIYYKGGVIRD